MRRRSFLLASLAVMALPAKTLGQTLDAAGCSVGFSNGMLQFSPECALLTVPGLGFGVTPPSHLALPIDEEATIEQTPQEERQLKLQAKRDKKRTQQARQHDRRTDKQDDNRRRRQRRRDRRASQATATATPTADVSE